jgi:hypothetical protein
MATTRMKVNVYLLYPTRIYYEFIVNKNDNISKIIKYLNNLYPIARHKYESSTQEPKFTNIDTNEEIDKSKTYEEHGLCDGCNIKVNLKIMPNLSPNILPYIPNIPNIPKKA